MKHHSKNDARKRVVWFLLVLCVIGFFIALYLTFQHYTGGTPNCSLVGGCEVVTTSKYATLFGIPISLFGTLYFFALIVSLFAWLQHKQRMFEMIAGILIILGAIISCILIAIQVFILDAICIYCMTTDSISIALLFLFFYKRERAFLP